MSSTETDDDCVYFEASLFQNEAYEKAIYTVDGECYELLSLDAACTDHDLTGQVVWPVSEYLSWFISRKVKLHKKSCLELGAGAGLPGIVAAKREAGPVILTDGNDLVLSLLEKNIALNTSITKPEVIPLLWGDRSSAKAIGRCFDVVLGADVVAWPNSVEPLLQTVAALLATEGSFYCGFVVRALSTERLFLKLAAEFGFVITEHKDFLPGDDIPTTSIEAVPASIRNSSQTLRILELRFRDPQAAEIARKENKEVFMSDNPQNPRWVHAGLAC